MSKSIAGRRHGLWVFGFLLPNIAGFLGFVLVPVVFSFWMAFTNWSLKPAVKLQFLGLRNFNDMLGVRALDRPHPALAWEFGLCVAGISGSLVGLLLTMSRKGRIAWVSLLLLSMVGIWVLNSPMWSSYELNDPRFWQYAYNTAFLMLGIPFSIAGSLVLAMLLNEELSLGAAKARVFGAFLCLGTGALAGIWLWGSGSKDLGLLCGLLWVVAALGFAFNVVAYRTLFYLPSFCAGVALMILWKALYNPETGPIDVGLGAMFKWMGLHIDPPQWLGSVSWAKPALILMGIWTGIGGTNMLLYLAGLSNVPGELIDAAKVDGAGHWSRFRNVVWPQLAPTTFFISIMAIIGGLQGGFEQAKVMTNGGPAGSTTTLAYYIYNKAFQDLDLGYAAAISWVLFAVVFVATAINWKFGRGLEVD